MAAEPPAAAPDPDDITPQDRFFLGGRSLSFRDFVAACMPAFPPREEIVPAPPPAPAPREAIWASRRPIRPQRS